MASFRFEKAIEILEDISVHILDIKNINLQAWRENEQFQKFKIRNFERFNYLQEKAKNTEVVQYIMPMKIAFMNIFALCYFNAGNE